MQFFSLCKFDVAQTFSRNRVAVIVEKTASELFARSHNSRLLQLGVLLYQLLQTEARELYRNLGLFTFSFALIDQAFAIFGMAHLLSRTESSIASGLLQRHLGNVEFLAARGKELGNVINRVVTPSRVRCRSRRFTLL